MSLYSVIFKGGILGSTSFLGGRGSLLKTVLLYCLIQYWQHGKFAKPLSVLDADSPNLVTPVIYSRYSAYFWGY